MRGIPDSSFFQDLVRVNSLEKQHFKEWLFQPGMLFRTTEKWWARGKMRQHPHEGLDICKFLAQKGQLIHLAARSLVPAAYAGTIAAIQKDFLGFSCFIRHSAIQNHGRELLSVFGHILPGQGIVPGRPVLAGDILGAVADISGQKPAPEPHLHLSLAWLASEFPDSSLNWETMNDPAQVILLNPLAILTGGFSILY